MLKYHLSSLAHAPSLGATCWPGHGWVDYPACLRAQTSSSSRSAWKATAHIVRTAGDTKTPTAARESPTGRIMAVIRRSWRKVADRPRQCLSAYHLLPWYCPRPSAQARIRLRPKAWAWWRRTRWYSRYSDTTCTRGRSDIARRQGTLAQYRRPQPNLPLSACQTSVFDIFGCIYHFIVEAREGRPRLSS